MTTTTSGRHILPSAANARELQLRSPGGTGQRLALVAQMRGLTEQQAAADCGVTMKTYRRYIDGAPQRDLPLLNFAWKHEVNIDWLFGGDGAALKRHIAVNPGGKLAVLPVSAV